MALNKSKSKLVERIRAKRRGDGLSQTGQSHPTRGDKAEGRFSLDIITGAQNLTTLSPADLFDRERPEDVKAACKMSREWHKNNWFVETIIGLQGAFYNYGLRILPAQPNSKGKLKKWLEEPGQKAALLRYIGSVWREWLMQDNVVSFWREKKKTTPFLLLPETCEYSDAMGIEKLKVTLGYKAEQLKSSGASERGASGAGPSNQRAALSAEEIKRYLANKIELSEEYDEYFRVLTRANRGQGMDIPRLYRVFRTLSQCESMEVGETMYAYAGRLVLRLHQLGFEVKSGSNAAKQAEYLWKKDRATAIETFFRGVQGFAETTTQFDHKISYVWTDPKFYDAKKWGTIIDRLLWWAGPVGFMMLAKSVSPFLLQILKARAEQDRIMVGAHLAEVIGAGFPGIPAVRLVWSNRCFYDSRLAWDMVKALLERGPLSLTTGLEEADFDPEQEKERKVAEAKPGEDAAFLPKFDPAHGKRPGEPAGRPGGTKDGDVVK